MKKVIGITGSIACGKSTVTRYLLDCGYQVVDSDKISHEALTIDSFCIEKVKQTLGCVNDGIVDRKALGRLIFHNQEAKQQLEAIVHPYVIDRLKQAIKDFQGEILFLDIPLLFELHLDTLCDGVIVVDVREDIQLQRLMERDNIDEAYAKTIIAHQMSLLEKRQKATWLLDNSQSRDYLYQQIDKLMERIKVWKK